ncbi:hypothetical protein POTOM_003306 [Populus tomentosa]|uniref:Uncharacterized protein n=1 Tax=Populus tomentosa TaxID=118781 RepID=A0A8X8J012_POPTO|nr:hypothetical protein POTOM_003306 [Populus tomentosa]
MPTILDARFFLEALHQIGLDLKFHTTSLFKVLQLLWDLFIDGARGTLVVSEKEKTSRLLGCCIQGEEKMLVYEYMPNKSLDTFIFDVSKRELLDWKKRFEIIEGIAQ